MDRCLKAREVISRWYRSKLDNNTRVIIDQRKISVKLKGRSLSVEIWRAAFSSVTN